MRLANLEVYVVLYTDTQQVSENFVHYEEDLS